MGVVTEGLITGQHSTRGDYARFATTALRRMAEQANVRLPESVTVADVAPLPAFVAQGHWVVDCPDCALNRCIVWPETPIYMCVNCWNVATDGHWRPVAMPADATAIEAALLARPFPADRNYLPSETPAELRAQTRAMKGGK